MQSENAFSSQWQEVKAQILETTSSSFLQHILLHFCIGFLSSIYLEMLFKWRCVPWAPQADNRKEQSGSTCSGPTDRGQGVDHFITKAQGDQQGLDGAAWRVGRDHWIQHKGLSSFSIVLLQPRPTGIIHSRIQIWLLHSPVKKFQKLSLAHHRAKSRLFPRTVHKALPRLALIIFPASYVTKSH